VQYIVQCLEPGQPPQLLSEAELSVKFRHYVASVPPDDGAGSSSSRRRRVAAVALFIRDSSGLYLRVFERSTYAPLGVPVHPTLFNVWQPFAAAGIAITAPPAQLRRELYAFFDLLSAACGDRADHLWYVVQLLANYFQHPASRPGVMLIFYGPQGSGKSSILNFIAAIAGERVHCAFTSRVDRDVTGEFNDLVVNTSLLVLHEVTSHGWGGLNGVQVLKNLLTDAQLTVHCKGKPAAVHDNFVHIIGATNDRSPLPAEAGTRRFFIVRYDEFNPRLEPESAAVRLAAATMARSPSLRAAVLHGFMAIPNVATLTAEDKPPYDLGDPSSRPAATAPVATPSVLALLTALCAMTPGGEEDEPANRGAVVFTGQIIFDLYSRRCAPAHGAAGDPVAASPTQLLAWLRAAVASLDTPATGPLHAPLLAKRRETPTANTHDVVRRQWYAGGGDGGDGDDAEAEAEASLGRGQVTIYRIQPGVLAERMDIAAAPSPSLEPEASAADFGASSNNVINTDLLDNLVELCVRQAFPDQLADLTGGSFAAVFGPTGGAAAAGAAAGSPAAAAGSPAAAAGSPAAAAGHDVARLTARLGRLESPSGGVARRGGGAGAASGSGRPAAGSLLGGAQGGGGGRQPPQLPPPAPPATLGRQPDFDAAAVPLTDLELAQAQNAQALVDRGLGGWAPPVAPPAGQQAAPQQAASESEDDDFWQAVAYPGEAAAP